MTNNNDFFFDKNSGISLEEQQEILSKINSINDKSRLSLAQGAVDGAQNDAEKGEKQHFKAKKTGGGFPVMVNAAALVVLAGGLLFLFSFLGGMEADIREGARIYGITERALIDEIRRETASKIAAKDMEILRVLAQLEEIGAELHWLHSGADELTAEQRAVQIRLLTIQEEYNVAFAALHEERAQILETSRINEAMLRVQIEQGAAEQGGIANAAMLELEQLSGEMQLDMAVSAHMGGGIALVNNLIRENRLDEAGETLNNLRLFLDTPAFQSPRFIGARKEFYTQTLNSLEALVEGLARMDGGFSFAAVQNGTEKILNELQQQNAQLEETIAGMNRTIAALSLDGTGQAQRLGELETSLSNTINQNTALQASLSEKEQAIAALETGMANLNNTLAARDNTIAARDNTVAALETNIANLNSTLAARDNTIAARDNTVAALETSIANLNSTLAARDNTINTQTQEIASLSSQLTQIREAMQAFLDGN